MAISSLPHNEQRRLFELAELDLDYSTIQDSLKDLTELASNVTGMPVSLINLIDAENQWSVGTAGIDLLDMPREDSVCQFTVLEENHQGFEVEDLSEDGRFNTKPYVAHDPNLRYYYGVPLIVDQDIAIGALCVLDFKKGHLNSDKKEFLMYLSRVVVRRLELIKRQKILEDELLKYQRISRKLAHDIRGPISGIIGLAELVLGQREEVNSQENEEFVALIQQSGKTVLELANDILSEDFALTSLNTLEDNLVNPLQLAEKIKNLFLPSAINKGIKLEIKVEQNSIYEAFSPKNILQITGNLISNAIKFTPFGGNVRVTLKLTEEGYKKVLFCSIKDDGQGMSPEKVEELLKGTGKSSSGTGGEVGYGFGLKVARRLVHEMKGYCTITSEIGKGTEFNFKVFPNG